MSGKEGMSAESTLNQRERGNHAGSMEESAYATPKKGSLPEKGTYEKDNVAAKSGSLSLQPRKPVTRSATRNKPPLCQSKQAHLDADASSLLKTRSKRKEREELETRPVKTCVMDKHNLELDHSSFKTKHTRSPHIKGFSKDGHSDANNTEVAEPNINILTEDLANDICSRLDLLEICRFRFMNKDLRNMTMTPKFARDHKRTGMTDWLITQYHTIDNPNSGIVKAIRLLDERLVSFNLEGYDINVGEHQSLGLKCILGSLLLFHVSPYGTLRTLNLSNGRVTTIGIPHPWFNHASFTRTHEFKLLPDPEHEFHYIIIHEQVLPHGVMHSEYRSVNQNWTQLLDAQPVANILDVNTQDHRAMIFESDDQLVRCVAFSAGQPVVLSQGFQQLTAEAFAEDGVFELNEQGDRVMGELLRLWSRGSRGWMAVVEESNENDNDPDNLIRIEGVVLFRLREDWSRVEFISRMPADLLPVHAYDLTEPLLEEVNGFLHLTFATRSLGARGCLVFSFNPASGWTSREQQNLMLLAAVSASPVFITRLDLIQDA